MRVINFLSRYRLALCLLMGMGLLVYKGALAIHCGQPMGCVDDYWAAFWLISYSDGYERRALLGQLIGWSTGGLIHFRALNSVAFSLVLSIGLVFFLAFARRHRHLPDLGLMLMVLMVGPTTTVFVEVLGDPLHVSLLLVFGYALLAKRLKPVSSAIIAVLVALMCCLVHEASIFLLLPAIYMVHCVTQGQAIRYTALVVGVLALAVVYSASLNAQSDGASMAGVITRDGAVFHAPSGVLPSFRQLLMEELTYYFGYLGGPMRLAFKVAGAFLWPALVLAVFQRATGNDNMLRLFVLMVLASSPLYVIAHDWGRFAIYSLLLSMFITSISPGPVRINCPAVLQRGMGWLSAGADRMGWPALVLCLAPAMFTSHSGYRVDGLTRQNMVGLVCSVVLYLVFRARGQISQAAGGDAPGWSHEPVDEGTSARAA